MAKANAAPIQIAAKISHGASLDGEILRIVFVISFLRRSV
jgi:hypothetical protein